MVPKLRPLPRPIFLLLSLLFLAGLPSCFPPFRKAAVRTHTRKEYHDSLQLKGYRVVHTRFTRLRPMNAPEMKNGIEINQVWIYDPAGNLAHHERIKTRWYGCEKKILSRKAWTRKRFQVPARYGATEGAIRQGGKSPQAAAGNLR